MTRNYVISGKLDLVYEKQIYENIIFFFKFNWSIKFNHKFKKS